MNFDDPGEFKDGLGRRIRDISVLTSWLPRNIAGVDYNCPYRYRGNNPKHWSVENDKILIYLNKRIGNFMENKVLD